MCELLNNITHYTNRDDSCSPAPFSKAILHVCVIHDDLCNLLMCLYMCISIHIYIYIERERVSTWIFHEHITPPSVNMSTDTNTRHNFKHTKPYPPPTGLPRGERKQKISVCYTVVAEEDANIYIYIYIYVYIYHWIVAKQLITTQNVSIWRTVQQENDLLREGEQHLP